MGVTFVGIPPQSLLLLLCVTVVVVICLLLCLFGGARLALIVGRRGSACLFAFSGG